MKVFKKLLLPLLIVSAIGLSSCSLFDDTDIEIHNSFDPKLSTPSSNPDAVIVNGVEGKEIADVSNALCFKNICYATNEKVANTYKVGGANENEFHVNNNEDYVRETSGNNYDLYVPNGLNKNEKHVVILFIHGGAWVSGFKTDVNEYVYEFARRGYVTATIKYTLLKRAMDDPKVSIFRNLDEIDACIASIKSSLGQLGFDTTKSQLVIGGASSGSHLAMLYSYSRGEKSSIPINFIVNAVGPVDIKEDGWKAFTNSSSEVLNGGITKEAIAAQQAEDNIKVLPVSGEGYNWNEYQTMRIANGMCGIPYTLEEVKQATNESEEAIVNPNDASNAMTKVGGGQDQLSVTYWMGQKVINRYPMICAYAGKDTVVGIAQYARLETALDNYSINHEFYYFKNCDHTDIKAEKDATAYNGFVSKIAEWCANI